MKNTNNGLIMVRRNVAELGLNRHGQHIRINSTTVHKIDASTEGGWKVLATFDDTIKLTPRGKSLQVNFTNRVFIFK